MVWNESLKDLFCRKAELYCKNSEVSLSGVQPLSRRYGNEERILPTLEENSSKSILECTPLETDGRGNFVDGKDRKIFLKGINVDGSMKFPSKPALCSRHGNCTDPDDIFFEGESVSFVGRPFPLEEAEEHFQRIKSCGYNMIRYLVTWEAIEHLGPGEYDEGFIDYTIKMLRKVYEIGGLYVVIDFHQDVWSRFSGGCGAPIWTFYAAGLQPRRFQKTEAVMYHNDPKHSKHPGSLPKMLWPTNYNRLASLTMFTLFFGGDLYFPKCKINGENVKFYLQRQFMKCVGHFWERITLALPEMLENGSLLGVELLNEPNNGVIGLHDIGLLHEDQQLRVDTCPTVFDCLKMGMGLPCELDVYRISIAGPKKDGTRLVDPLGCKAWLSPEEAKFYDNKYHWERDPEWTMGQCIYLLHGIWGWKDDFHPEKFSLLKLAPTARVEIVNQKCFVLDRSYFSRVQSPDIGVPKGTLVDFDFFTNHSYIDFYVEYKAVIRAVTPRIFLFMEPPVMEVPPRLKGNEQHIVDSKTVFSPHYYDGMSLMFKSWNSKYNVDTLGILRKRYSKPFLGITFGEKAIKNSFARQFIEIKRECEENLGSIPVLMSETGMPFDMDNKQAYKDGDYSSQTTALDMISLALEALKMSHAYWCYTSINSHDWGDSWNNEDFSFWSLEDSDRYWGEDSDKLSGSYSSNQKPVQEAGNESVSSEKPRIFSRRRLSSQNKKTNNIVVSDRERTNSVEELSPENSKNVVNNEIGNGQVMEKDTLGERNSLSYSRRNSDFFKTEGKLLTSPDGIRAVNAVVRPYVIATRGDIVVTEFNLKIGRFALTVKFDSLNKNDSKIPTVIFVPRWHYPALTYEDIYLTSGSVKYNEKLEYLEWYHDSYNQSKEDISNNGNETLIIKSNKRFGPYGNLRPGISSASLSLPGCNIV